jgi:hypothetical protein
MGFAYDFFCFGALFKPRWCMDEACRERRMAELRALQSSDPRELIAKYCATTGEPASSQLPHGISFSRMIESIVEFEGAREKSAVATD